MYATERAARPEPAAGDALTRITRLTLDRPVDRASEALNVEGGGVLAERRADAV
jgi:hypothetical protein